ncbi:AAA family ATPase [Shewanella algae]|uniref:Lon-insertion domain-containing protein n=1 Tax=Shewanella algae TaxID=38313 RepID=UPI001AAEE967|nr:Lon-insertion domain-containing protein [Shewanella algae]MBO2637012.1 AAA family ATPase [Shewanella algae]
MKPSLIPAGALTPQYSNLQLPTSSQLTDLLLGQERVIDAFGLLQTLSGQQLFLADFQGIHRTWLFEALSAQSKMPMQYLSGRITRAQLLGYPDSRPSRQSGALAKPGLLFICTESLWKREPLWELLLDAIEKGGFELQGQWQPLQAKVVLVGSSLLYSELRYHERRFSELFALLGELVFEIDLQKVTVNAYVAWLAELAKLSHCQLTESALLPLLRYSSRLTEHQQRLSLASADLAQVFAEAAFYSQGQALDAHAIEHALAQRQQRHNAQEQQSAQNLDDAFIYLPTEGAMVGQINGLTVIDTLDYCYGEPARITASVHYGDGEVADIERKSELAGNIHAKGMMILSACLYRVFGRDAPLHLNANIVFEQSYQEIDGDSASLAEYCSLISAITEQPIDQGLAVTGALDQFGNVQAIGGVNEKIEGFFKLCSRRGLTGSQGVIMPKSNVQQLNLAPEIIAAVEQGQFLLYEITHVDQAVTLLMGIEAGEADEDNNFPEDTLYGMVQQRLDKLAGNLDEEPGYFASLLARLPFFRQ